MADSLAILLLLTLAAYRVATDLAWETGPGALFEQLRGWAVQRGGLWAEGMTCPICLSLWAALTLTLLAGLLGLYDPWHWPLYWLASAGGAAYLARQKGGD